MSDRLNHTKIQQKATIKILDKLTQEAKQLAKEVDNYTKHKLNSNKGVITNKLGELNQLDHEIMELLTDEEEITNIMVTSTEFEIKVNILINILNILIENILTDKFRVLNVDDPIHIESDLKI